MKQAFNPYLPSFEYVPDGEPHLFNNRIYLYGSHDRCDSAGFCLNDYVCYSAAIEDLTDWKYEGVIYRKNQDPRNQNIPEDAPEQPRTFGIEPKREADLNPRGIHAMFAPDVVCGLDGRYYLYYCLDFLPEIGVAVSDSPAGPFKYLGFVQHQDGTPLGQKEDDYLQFDPGIFIDDDQTIYLYSGNAPIRLDYEPPRQQSQVMTLEKDMITLKTEPKKFMPDLRDADPTYKEHEFFEASSIRKINGKYYFVYSSVRSHELCYAISDHPDHGFIYGGTLVSIGDIFLDGRTLEEANNALGNTHGGIERAGDRWYVFYHRQTNRTNFSRQGCAEEIFFDKDGKIAQAEVTSCGLNQGSLKGNGTYPAYIACHLTAENGVTDSHPMAMREDYPYFTQDILDTDPTEELLESDQKIPFQYIHNLKNGSAAGYKYFTFENSSLTSLEIRGTGEGVVQAFVLPKNSKGSVDPSEKEAVSEAAIRTEHFAGLSNGTEAYLIAEQKVNISSGDWIESEADIPLPDGEYAFYLRYLGSGSIDLRRFTLS